MADHDGAAAREHAGQRGHDRGLGLGVDALGGFVEQEQRPVGEQRAGEGHAALLPRRQARAALADPGVEGDVEAGGPGRRGHVVVGRLGPRQPQVVGHGADDQHRALRHPGDPLPPGGGIDVGEVDPADGDPPALGTPEPEQQVEQGRLARAAGAADADGLGGSDPQPEPLEHRPGAAVDGDVLHPQRHARGVGGGATVAAGRHGRGLEDREHLARGGEALHAVVEAGAHGPQRQVDLRGQHDREQAGLQVQRAVDEAQADRDRDQGDRQGGQDLEHQRGEERDAQGPHRGAAVLVGDGAEALGLASGPAERDEDVEPGDEVEEVVAEHGERPPAPRRVVAGVQADQDHEDRDERDRRRDDDGRHPVRGEQPDPHEHRHRRGQQQGRQVAPQVPVERVHAAGRQGGELGGGGQAGVAGPEPQDVVDEVGAQLGPDARAGAHGGGLRGPGQQGPSRDHADQDQEHRGQDGEALAAEERPAHGAREQVRLGDDESGRGHARGGREHHEGAGRADVAQQARVERPHGAAGALGAASRPAFVGAGSPAGAGMSVRVTRRRKTQ